MIKISILSRIHITKAERKKSKYTTHSFLLRKKKGEARQAIASCCKYVKQKN